MRIMAIVLVLAGLYMAFDHTPPLPLNHEEIGLGALHTAHTVFGAILLIAGVVVFWLGRRRKAAAPAA